MKLIEFIGSIFKEFVRQNSKYHRLVNNGKENKSIYFGILSLVYILLAAVIGGFLLKTFPNISDSGNPLVSIFMLILILFGGIATLLLFIYSLTAIIYQFKINKRLISFIFLLLFLAFAIIAFYFVTQL